MKYCLLILIFLEAILYVNGKFHIEKSGIFPVGKDDIGIRFFLKVVNNADHKLGVVKARQPECCWDVEPGDKDCESMQLFGGFQVEIDKATSKNITYVFPNIYPLDRIGECTFYLKEAGKEGNAVLIHKVKFDTSLDDNVSGGFMSSLFGGGPAVYKRCNGIDENLRNNCHPFNCAKKYNGFRNFYRKKIGKCERVSKCTTRVGSDDLPISAFDIENNRCKDLIPKELKGKDKEVADDILDSSSLKDERDKYVDINPTELVIDCNHGFQEGHYCRCYKGWKTVSVKTKNGGLKMNWCSKKVKLKSVGKKSYKYVRWGLFSMLILVSLMLLTLLIYSWWSLFIREILPRHLNRTKSTSDEQMVFLPHSAK